MITAAPAAFTASWGMTASCPEADNVTVAPSTPAAERVRVCTRQLRAVAAIPGEPGVAGRVDAHHRRVREPTAAEIVRTGAGAPAADTARAWTRYSTPSNRCHANEALPAGSTSTWGSRRSGRRARACDPLSTPAGESARTARGSSRRPTWSRSTRRRRRRSSRLGDGWRPGQPVDSVIAGRALPPPRACARGCGRWCRQSAATQRPRRPHRRPPGTERTNSARCPRCRSAPSTPPRPSQCLEGPSGRARSQTSSHRTHTPNHQGEPFARGHET